MARKVMKKLKEEVERKGLKLSVTEDGKEGKSKMIASCGFLENELRQFSREKGSDLGRQRGNTWCRPDNEGKKVGRKGKSEEEEVQGKVFACREE